MIINLAFQNTNKNGEYTKTNNQGEKTMKKQFCFILAVVFLSMCTVAIAEEESCSGLVGEQLNSCCKTESDGVYQGCMYELNANLESICYDYAQQYIQYNLEFYKEQYCTSYVSSFCYQYYPSVYPVCMSFYFAECMNTVQIDTWNILASTMANCIANYTLQNDYYCKGVASSAQSSCMNPNP